MEHPGDPADEWIDGSVRKADRTAHLRKGVGTSQPSIRL